MAGLHILLLWHCGYGALVPQGSLRDPVVAVGLGVGRGGGGWRGGWAGGRECSVARRSHNRARIPCACVLVCVWSQPAKCWLATSITMQHNTAVAQRLYYLKI